MNDLSHTIRKFNRFELKYLITLEQAEKFKKSLQAYLIPDEHGNNNGGYAVSSLYYDSPELSCYWEKENGVKTRRKLRIRRYETGDVLTEESLVYLEIKQRIDRVTQKRRLVLTYGDALRLCNDRQSLPVSPEDEAVMNEMIAFIWQYNLRPVSIVRYDRQAFIGTKYDIGLRVTFDTMLTSQVYPLHLHEKPSGIMMMPPNQVVMEIKVNERIPYWLTEMIAVHNLQTMRVSKYCQSIKASKNQLSTLGQYLPAESSQEVLSTTFSVFSTLEQKMGIQRHQ